MSRAIMFDFFGTLVEYQADRAELAYPHTHRLACTFGCDGDHDTFVSTWDATSRTLEQQSQATLYEFSMTDAARSFAEAHGVKLTEGQLDELGSSFLDEWLQHVRPVPGVVDMIERLSASWTVAVVSNTHDASMVPNMISEMGISSFIAVVTLSIEHGRLKPHDSIYHATLDAMGVDAQNAVFVGDNYDADYAGPIRAGIRAILVDPDRRHRIPDAHRVSKVTEVEALLGNLD